MVAMGRALMSRPKLLLMDEPSMGLAPILVERSFEIIKQVNDAGVVAMLVVEQNANVSLSIADRGYVLSTGRIVLEGNAADLLQNEDFRKATLAAETKGVGAAIRGEFRSSRRRRTSTRARRGRSRTACGRRWRSWLAGWDANGAEWDFWVERNEAFRAAIARLLHAEPDDVAVTTSVSQGVSALVWLSLEAAGTGS